MDKKDKKTRADTDKRKVQEEDKRWLDNVCHELFWRVGERAVAQMLRDKLDDLYKCDGLERRIERLEKQAEDVQDEETKCDLVEIIENIKEDRETIGEIRRDIDKMYKKIDGVFLDLGKNLSSLEKMLGAEKPSLKEL